MGIHGDDRYDGDNDAPTFQQVMKEGIKSENNALAKQPQVHSKFVQQSTCMDSLEASLMTLIEKIEPILGPNNPEPGHPEDPQDTPEMSSVARVIDNNIDRVLALDRAVNRAIRRIEV